MATKSEKMFNINKTRDWVLPVGAISPGRDGLLTLGEPPPPSRHHFSFDGVETHIFLSEGHRDNTCKMWTKIGLMPYSAEGGNKRLNTVQILKASQHLDRVRFVVEKDQNIFALYENTIIGVCTLDILMIEILMFLNEMTPFARLIQGEAKH